MSSMIRILLLCVLFFCLPVCAQAEEIIPVNDLKNHYYDFFVQVDNWKPEYFSAGPQEKTFIAQFGTDWSVLPMQQRFSGLKDKYYEQFVYNISEEMTGLDNPDAYMLAVHYPQATGNAAVDKILERRAKEDFYKNLAIDPALIGQENPLLWFRFCGHASTTT